MQDSAKDNDSIKGKKASGFAKEVVEGSRVQEDNFGFQEPSLGNIGTN